MEYTKAMALRVPACLSSARLGHGCSEPNEARAWLNAATLGMGEARRANARAQQCGPFPRNGIALRTHAEARQSHAKQRPSAATHGDVPQWHGIAGRRTTAQGRCEVSPISAMAERPGPRLWHCRAPRRRTQALRTATVHRLRKTTPGVSSPGLGKAPRASAWHRHGVALRAHARARRTGPMQCTGEAMRSVSDAQAELHTPQPSSPPA